MQQQTKCDVHGHELPPGALRPEPVPRPAHPAGRGRPPERHDPVRPRSPDLGARRRLPGARGGQPLRRGRELLPVERRGEPGADHHGQRAARRRPHPRASRRTTGRRRVGARRCGGGSGGMNALVLLFAAAFALAATVPANAQSTQPWAGRGAVPSQPSAAVTPMRAASPRRLGARKHGGEGCSLRRGSRRRPGGRDGRPHRVGHGPVSRLLHQGPGFHPGHRRRAPGRAVRGTGWRLRRPPPGRPPPPRRRVPPAHRVPGLSGPACAGGCPQQRPLVPARRHHRAGHGQRLRPAALVQGPPRVDRPAEAAGDDPERRRHPRLLLSRPGRPPTRGPPVPAGQGRRQVARGDRPALSRHRPHGHRGRGHAERASRSTATCSGSAWPARA